MKIIIILLLVSSAIGFTQGQTLNNDLSSLAEIHQGISSKRVSSYDRTGGVAYWYQDKASKLPAIPGGEAREPLPIIGPADIHRWRNEWRKNHGNSPKLWGN